MKEYIVYHIDSEEILGYVDDIETGQEMARQHHIKEFRDGKIDYDDLDAYLNDVMEMTEGQEMAGIVILKTVDFMELELE